MGELARDIGGIAVTLSEISIKNSVFAWMLMAALVLFGGIAFMRLGVSQMPDVDFPVVNIQLKYEGASPAVMETDVVDIVEDAVMTVQGIRNLSSVSKNEMATVTVEFNLDRDIDLAVQEIQSKIAQVQSRLPIGVEPPTVTKNNPEDNPIMWVSLSGDMPVREMMAYARDILKNNLQTVEGVSEIILGGYIEPNLRVWVDAKKLAENDLTIGDVVDAIGNEHVEIPAGRLETKDKEYELRFLGEAVSPEEFENILIQKRGEGGPIYKQIRIGDVARAELGTDDVRRISRTNGKPAIGLGLKKQRGANAVSVAQGVKKKLEVIRESLPEGLAVQVNFDSTKFIEESVHELNFTLLLSAALTGVVCLLFLGSLRAAFNIVLAIPTSLVGTFLVLYFLGFTLNTFTLLGLILAVGIVVDDAIMVLENIIRHQEMGKTRKQGALDGSKEITSAALAATLAIIAIFIPVIFMEGIIGRFFFQFGITMSVAVALSLLEALTLTPMRASRFVSAKDTHSRWGKVVDRIFDKLSHFYQRILTVSLNHRWKTIFLALAFFLASFLALSGLKKEFVPAQDRGSFLIRVETPLGSSINLTDEKIRVAENMILKHGEVLRYYAAIGGFQGGEVNSAMFFITLKDMKQRPIDPATGNPVSQFALMDKLRKEMSAIPNMRVMVQDLSASGFSANRGFPVEFSVRGPDWEKLAGYSRAIMDKMKETKLYLDIDTNYKFGVPELRITPDRDAAAARGVSLRTIGETVSALVGGQRIALFNEDGRRNDVRIRVQADSVSPEDLTRGLFVRNYRGEQVPLSDVVTVTQKSTLQSITRENRERSISIYANPAPGESLDKLLSRVQEIGSEILPPGYRVVMGGTAQTFQESFESLMFILVLGIVVAYMILASQYNSFVHPFTVLLALPFSLSGAWVALRITGYSLNIYSFIGLILLMGIVKKNSILLVDFANQKRDHEGMGVRDALMAACPQRLRPILMTSVATIAAAIPPAIGVGVGSENNVPMAVVVLGGVLVSTLLSLFVVPAAYSLLSRLERKDVDA